MTIQKQIRSGFHTRLQFTAGYDSPPEDWLEEFVRQDHARHGTAGDISRGNNTEDPCAAYLAPSPPRRRNASPSRSHQNSGNDTPSRGTSSSRSRVYIPQYSSGPFSVLATLHLSMHSKHKLSRGRRLLTLTENELKRRTQPMCRSNLYDKGRIRGRNAFQCMDGLVEKQLVRKEIVRNTEISGEIEKWGLSPEGELLGQYCSEFHRAVDHVVNEGKSGKSNTNLALCLDTREDVHLLERIKMCCEDENVPFTEKELPAGDYLFLERSGGQDHVLPLVIERKSWSDLADSCLGKGRAMNRLDCVSLGSNIDCAGNCQICKMKRSGCTQIMFIIEGERCLARDGTHRSVKKCSFDNCCSVCKQLTERHGHGVTQDVLEGVLHRIQVEHGCLIHYTRSYNETIQSIFDMRMLLQSEPKCLKEKAQSYESYASNSRSRSANNIGQLPPRPTSVQELNIEEMLALVGDVWDVDTVRQSLGLGTTLDGSRFLSSCQSKQPRNKTSGNGNAGDIIELDGASDPVCIDLESARREDSTKVSMSSANKRRKTDNHEAICLDLDSDVEEIEPIRGGGDSFDLSTDDDEIEVVAPASNNKRGNSTTSSRKQGKQKHRSVSSSTSDRLQHDVCLLSSDDESSQVQQSMSRKRKAREVVANGVDKSNPLLILEGWHDYEVKFHKRLENIWKEVYLSATDNGHMGDFYSTAVSRLNEKMRESTYPFVRRRTLMRFTLWMQLVMQVQIRVVLRTRFSDEIKVRLGQKQKVATDSENISHLMQSSSPARALEYAASHSTPIHQSATTLSANRKRPPSTNNRESDFVREARLRRFESASGSRKCPPATSSSSVDRSNRKRPPMEEFSVPRSSSSSHHPTSWSCPKCTLENKLDDTSCSACGGISPMKASEDWSCSVCTLLNNASNTNCSACSSSKVPTAASASLHPNNAHLARPASSSYADNVSSSYSPMSGSAMTQSQSKVKRTVRCGACGNEGHNRSNATEHNCPAYFDDKEIDRREKLRLKRDKEIAQEKEAIEAMQRQNETSDRMQAELRKQIEALERDKKIAEEFRKEELKRRKKKVERLQKRQNK